MIKRKRITLELPPEFDEVTGRDIIKLLEDHWNKPSGNIALNRGYRDKSYTDLLAERSEASELSDWQKVENINSILRGLIRA